MLEIYINSRKTSNVRQAVLDAIENGQYDTLADDIRDCFTEEQIEEIEEHLDSNDIDETIDDLLSDWSGDSMGELLQELNEIFTSADIDLTFDNGLDLDEDNPDIIANTLDVDFESDELDDFSGNDNAGDEDDDEEDEGDEEEEDENY